MKKQTVEIDIELLDSPSLRDKVITSEIKQLNGLGQLDGLSWKKFKRGFNRTVKSVKKKAKKIGKTVVKTTADVVTLGAYHYQKKVTSQKKIVKRAEAELARFLELNAVHLSNCANPNYVPAEKDILVGVRKTALQIKRVKPGSSVNANAPRFSKQRIEVMWNDKCVRANKRFSQLQAQVAHAGKRLDKYRKRRKNVLLTVAAVAAVATGPAMGAAMKTALASGKGALAKLLVGFGVNKLKAEMIEKTMQQYPPDPGLVEPDAQVEDAAQKAANAADESLIVKAVPWVAAAALAAMGILA